MVSAGGVEIPWLSGPWAKSDKFLNYKDVYKDGITSQYTIPPQYGGKRFDYHMMNGMGYLATVGTFLWQCGYPFSEHDIEMSKEFGGYPKGAVVYTVNKDGYLVEYRSKIDNNMNPLPSFVNGAPVEDDYWLPLYELDSTVGIPNFKKVIAQTSKKINYESFQSSASSGAAEFSDNTFSVSLDISSPSWVVVERTMTDWRDLDRIVLTYGTPDINVMAYYGDESVQIDSLPVESGKTATASFPMDTGTVAVESSNYNWKLYDEIIIKITAYEIDG